MTADPRRHLPRVDDVLALLADLPRDPSRAAVRASLQGRRQAGIGASAGDVAAEARAAVTGLVGGRLRPVINATGVVLHTNLGRAPWSAAAVERAMAVARGYANVELDLETGRRGGRMLGVSQLFGALTGAESALIVNNGAAALLLALTALAAGREVLVSRGELVEIGGGFRVPEVVAAGGARLVEVGTTNRTRVEDFARAITPQTAVILSVHPSNFRITGFTERPDRADLADLARQHGLRFVEDAGSGAVEAIGDEPLLRDVVTHADVVTCSGDKLLGGPQAGIILGRTEAISTLSAHPLLRALRVDKVTMAALEATLAGWLTGARPPAAEMLAASPDALRRRSLAFIQALGAGEIVDGAGLPGGGALPGVTLEGPVVRLSTPDPERTLRRLREGATPVIARVSDGAVTLDLRTVPADDTPGLVEAVRAATVEAPS